MSPQQSIIDDSRAPDWREILGALRVLRQDQYEAWITAEGIMAATQRQAEQLKDQIKALAAQVISDAKRDAEVIKQNATREAERLQGVFQQQGYDAGHKAALMEGEKINRTWGDIGSRYAAELNALVARERAQIVTLASMIAETVVRKSLADSNTFLEHLTSLLEENSGQPLLVMQVHPDQVEAVKRNTERFPYIKGCKIEPDRSLELGDVRLQYAFQNVDGRIHTMVGSIGEVILQDMLLDKEPK